MACRLAIVGATGEVGRAVLAALEDMELALAEVHVLASADSAEETLMFKGRPLLVGALDEFDFAQADIAIFAVPAEVSAKFVSRARAAGCRVIDHSAAFRDDADVPLIMAPMTVPRAEVVACPDALTALLVPVLGAVANIESVEVTVLKPVSAAGRAGVRELAGQTGELLNGRGIEPSVFPAQIAFNTLPLESDASVFLMDELERLLPEAYPVAVAEVGVPVFYGLTLGLSIRMTAEPALPALRQRLAQAGVLTADPEENQGLVTPVTDSAGQAGVYMAGLRPLPAPLQGVQLWVVGDNLRQGAARHSIHILENWIKDFKY